MDSLSNENRGKSRDPNPPPTSHPLQISSGIVERPAAGIPWPLSSVTPGHGDCKHHRSKAKRPFQDSDNYGDPSTLTSRPVPCWK